MAGFDGNRSLVVPTDALYPHVSHETATAETGAQMADSQTQAKVAGHAVPEDAGDREGSGEHDRGGFARGGVLESGDRLLKVGDKQITTLKDVSQAVNASEWFADSGDG